MRILLAAVLVFSLPALAGAQTAVPPAFLGTWAGLGLNPGAPPLGAPPSELPWAALDKALGNFMLPWAIAYQQTIEWNIDDTGQVCKPTGPFRQGHASGAGFRFVAARPGMLYQVGGSIDQRGVQRIALDAPRSRTPRPTWNGESTGRIEGTDTLVVDTIGFNDKSWLNSDRWPHTEELRVIERYRLYGGGAYMQLRVFIDDRKALKEPYTYTRYTARSRNRRKARKVSATRTRRRTTSGPIAATSCSTSSMRGSTRWWRSTRMNPCRREQTGMRRPRPDGRPMPRRPPMRSCARSPASTNPHAQKPPSRQGGNRPAARRRSRWCRPRHRPQRRAISRSTRRSTAWSLGRSG